MYASLPNFYKNALKSFRKTTVEEDAELHTRYQKGDKLAGDMMVTNNLGLLVSLAYKYAKFADINDLISAGHFGLMEALAHFDPAKKKCFSMYAAYWIRSRMIRHLDSETHCFGEADADGKRARVHDLSLNESIDSDDGEITEFIDNLRSPSMMQDDELTFEETKAAVRDTLNLMSKRSQYVLECRFMSDEPMSLEEIGLSGKYRSGVPDGKAKSGHTTKHKQVSRECVRQEELIAVAKFKRLYEMHDLRKLGKKIGKKFNKVMETA